MNPLDTHSQSVELAQGKPFVLKNGNHLHELVIQYETWGELSPEKNNAILLCHALTGDSHAIGWWDGLVGEGLAIDTNKYFVVCSNVLGGCHGSTGPASPRPEQFISYKPRQAERPKENHPKRSRFKIGFKKSSKSLKPRQPSGRTYGSDFPTVTIRDMVRAQELLSNYLGVDSWLSVIGGSMGGMQALEWAAIFPERVRSIAPLCSTLAATPWQIAFSSVGRNIIESSAESEVALAMARAVAMISYRSDELFESRFGRDLLNPNNFYGLEDKFQVESYLDHQGDVLKDSFDPDSYLILNKAMDLHDIGRNRGGIERVAQSIKTPTLILSVDSDLLYPVRLQTQMSELIQGSRHEIINSKFGHDGFLLETTKIGEIMDSFLRDVKAKSNTGRSI